MRKGKTGRSISLRDELADAISENLPRGTVENEMDSFCSSKDYEKLLDEAMEVIKSHIDEAVGDGIQEALK